MQVVSVLSGRGLYELGISRSCDKQVDIERCEKYNRPVVEHWSRPLVIGRAREQFVLVGLGCKRHIYGPSV